MAVVMGGVSAEREISLQSGRALSRALREAGFSVVEVEVVSLSPGNEPSFAPVVEGALATSFEELPGLLRAERCEVAVLALHGPYGEDGHVQALLEVAGIPYTGSGVLASALGMDKSASKRTFKGAGVRVPEGFEVRAGEPVEGVFERAKGLLGLPVVVKPTCQGSTVGVGLAHDLEEFERALKGALRYGPAALVEEFVPGREVTVGVVEFPDEGGPRPLPPIEIRPLTGTGLYDFEAKYAPGGSEHLVPAPLTEAERAKAEEAALRAYKALGCSGVARVDMRLREDGSVFVLEVNTIPGFTERSLVPEAARAAGISFPELASLMVETALRRAKEGGR